MNPLRWIRLFPAVTPVLALTMSLSPWLFPSSNSLDLGPATSWAKSSANVEAPVSMKDGELAIAIPFREVQRDNFSLSRTYEAKLNQTKFIHLRVFIPLKSSLTVETLIDGKRIRLVSYRAGTGDWETWSLPISGSVLQGLNLSFGEPGNAIQTGSETRTSRVRGLWLSDSVETVKNQGSTLSNPMDYGENLKRVLGYLRPDSRKGLPTTLSPRGKDLADRFFRRLRHDESYLEPARVSNSILRTLSNQTRLQEVMDHQVTLLGGIPKQDVGFPIQWLTFPKGDYQWGQHLSYQYWMKPLAYAYAGTRKEDYAVSLVSNVLDWIRTFPLEGENLRWMGSPKSFGEGIPATREGAFIGEPVGIGPWVSLNSEWVVHSWPEMMALIHDSPALDNEAAACILRSLLEDHLWQLLNHDRSHTANQYVAVGEALIHLGMWFPDFTPTATAETVGWRRIDSFCRNQIYPDGSMAECSPNYAMGSLGKLFELWKQGKERGRTAPVSLGERIPAAMNYWAFVSDPFGRVPRIAKGSGDALRRLAPMNDIFSNKQVAWRLSWGAEGLAPAVKSFLYDWAGHAAMRTSFDSNATWLFFEPGPRGAGHHDLAQLNLQMVCGGDTLLADPGFYTYSTSGEEGDMAYYLHGTSAHNLALIDGEGQRTGRKGSVATPGDYGWKIDGETVTVRGAYTNGFGEKGDIAVEHSREVRFHQGTGLATVVDRFTGTGRHRIEVRWQTDPLAEVTLAQGGAVIRMPKSRLSMTFESSPRLEWQVRKGENTPHAGWFSSGYGNLQASSTLCGVVDVDLPFEITTHLVPKQTGIE